MRRTELLQEIRMMGFEEAYYGWKEQRLTQEEAAQLLEAVAGPFAVISTGMRKKFLRGFSEHAG